MKKLYRLSIYIILFTLIFVATLSACDKPDKKVTFEEALPFSEDLACVKKDGLYGFINKDGEIVIEPTYDSPNYFYNGVTVIQKDGLFGMIDRENNIIIPFEYEEITPATANYLCVKKEGKYGCINYKGETVIDFTSSSPIQISEQSADHIIAVITSDNGKEGFIDLVTGFKIDPIYNFISPWNNNESIVGIALDGKNGFINLDTQVVFEPFSYDNIYFTNGLALVCVDFKYGYIDLNGNYVIEPIYDHGYAFSEELAFVKIGNKYGCINTKGEVVIEPAFDFGSQFTNGVAEVMMDSSTNEMIYINTAGETIDINEYYKSQSSYFHEVAPHMKIIPTYYIHEELGQRAMAIDRDGKVLFKTIYDYINYFDDKYNLGQVVLDSKLGCINEKGIEILPPVYDDLIIIDKDTFIVSEGGKYGIINRSRNEVLPFKYGEVQSSIGNLIFLKLEDKWGYYNIETKELKENLYDEVFAYGDYPLTVRQGDEWFYIDENGDEFFK